MEEELAALLALLEWITVQQAVLEDIWLGRCVRLTESFGRLPSPNEGIVALPAGAVGQIVNLRLDRDAPFVVEFSGFPYRVAPLLGKLELADTPT